MIAKKYNKLKPRLFRSDLDAAICYLIGMGIIERQDDILKSVEGLSKGNLSTFKNTGKYTTTFKTKFQDAYGLELKDFDPKTYSLADYIIKKSGAAKLPDQLLTQMHEQIETMKISLLKLADLVPSVQEESSGREVTFDHSLSGKNQ